MEEVKGTISINPEKETITIRLENGSYCVGYYVSGAMRFLNDEIELLKEQSK